MENKYPIYEKTHRSGNRSWIVCLGKVNGKREFRSFRTREQAEHFRANCLETAAAKKPESLADLSELARASTRVGIEKLKPYDATVDEAIEYFIKHAKPSQGKVTIQEAMDLFRERKTKDGCSGKYIKTSRRCYFAPFRDAFKNCLINDVSASDAQKYIDVHDAWSAVSKNTHNRHLRALYAFCIKTGHTTINPFESVEFVRMDVVDDVRSKLIPVKSVKLLLQFAFDEGYYAECAAMVLVFFCGVRPEEVSRLEWVDIKLEIEKPFVDLLRTKKRRRRINIISENAVHWLRLCASKGAVAPGNYEKRMQRLRGKAKIPYPQNAARHCFCSYHIALHEDGAKTAVLLGHANPSLLYSTYREVVTKEDASRYFEILPRSVEDARKLEKERKLAELDAIERANAEAESCRGRAFKDASGKWIPIDPLIPDDLESPPVFDDALQSV